LSEDDPMKEISRKMALLFISGNGFYFNDLEGNKRIEQYEYRDRLVNVIQKPEKYNWKIKDETKMIGNYKCNKAISYIEVNQQGTKLEKELVVWFTPEIPVPFGPKGIDGLPGLMLEVPVSKDYYLYASEINIGQDIVKEKDLTLPKGGSEISEEEWDEFHRKENERIRKKSK
jgi:GLPGLI family protein